MKALKYLLVPLIALVTALSCRQNDPALQERALELCKYIPDHSISDDAVNYLTPDFYTVLTEAWDAPDGAFPGEIGESEWLYYFVTGNGGSLPHFTVESAWRTGKNRAVAMVLLGQVWEPGGEVQSERPCSLEMELCDGEWLLDDFDGIKEACRIYVKELREKYRTGAFVTEFERYLQEHPGERDILDPEGTYASDLDAAIHRFYEIYGE